MASSPAISATAPIDEISLAELASRLNDRSLTVVDVLPSTAYQQGHVPGAISLPLAEVSDRAVTALPDKHAELAIYCASFT